MTTLAERYQSVLADIAVAAEDAGRDSSEITTIVVTKFHPVTLVRELAELGARDFGENRHQEAAEKAAHTVDLAVRWHFIGQLQTNKAVAALTYASVVHSVDRLSLVGALAKGELPVDIFLQLNLTEDPTRGGVTEDELEPLAEAALATGLLRVRGLMAVAPVEGSARHAFARTAATLTRLQRVCPDAHELSMGMSGDYREAILEGATHLRIGAAITGMRPQRG